MNTMGRAPCCDKNGLKKGPWTPEEDKKLIDYIQKHGYGNWRTLPKNAGLQRCGKSCRLRWTNYLRPDIKRGRFSFEEEETIIQLHKVLGNKWSAIASSLPGRTDNEIKNYWNTHIRKRLLRMGIDPVTHSPRLDLLDLSSILASLCASSSSQMNNNNNYDHVQIQRLLNGGTHPLQLNPELLKLASSVPVPTQNNLNLCADQNAQQHYQIPYHDDDFVTCVDPNPSFFTNDVVPDELPGYGYTCINYSSESDHVVPQSLITDPPLIMAETQTSNFQCLNNSNCQTQNFGFASVLSTPTLSSSSPTSLNSNYSTFMEDERDHSSHMMLNLNCPRCFRCS